MKLLWWLNYQNWVELGKVIGDISLYPKLSFWSHVTQYGYTFRLWLDHKKKEKRKKGRIKREKKASHWKIINDYRIVRYQSVRGPYFLYTSSLADIARRRTFQKSHLKIEVEFLRYYNPANIILGCGQRGEGE